MNIDGRLILDFDENRILASVELLGRMSGGKGRMAVDKPAGKAGDICLGGDLSGSSAFDWPVVVSMDGQRDMGRIGFDDGDFDRAVALSDDASALLRGNRLIGFWFSLAR